MTRVILDLCGGSGSWSQPYRDAGYEVLTVDPAGEPAGAIREDVRTWQLPKGLRVHGILAAPPCTHLSGSGARWWSAKGPEALTEALSVADACLRIIVATNPVWWSLENPIGRLSRYLGPCRDLIQPWQYGDPWTKATCLWGTYRLPLRQVLERPADTDGRIWRAAPGPGRARFRSLTPPGFAAAFYRANP